MKSQGEKNKELYNFIYKKTKKNNKNNEKIYNIRFTDEDKEKVSNSFSFKKM